MARTQVASFNLLPLSSPGLPVPPILPLLFLHRHLCANPQRVVDRLCLIPAFGGPTCKNQSTPMSTSFVQVGLQAKYQLTPRLHDGSHRHCRKTAVTEKERQLAAMAHRPRQSRTAAQRGRLPTTMKTLPVPVPGSHSTAATGP